MHNMAATGVLKMPLNQPSIHSAFA